MSCQVSGLAKFMGFFGAFAVSPGLKSTDFGELAARPLGVGFFQCIGLACCGLIGWCHTHSRSVMHSNAGESQVRSLPVESDGGAMRGRHQQG